MDPIAIALQTVAAIAAGAVVGYITQRFAFQDTQRLATDERAAARADAARGAAEQRLSALRALRDEVEANLRLVNRPDQSHLGHLGRSAWDDARRLALPEELRGLLRTAYNEAEVWNRAVDRTDMRDATPGFSTAGERVVLAGQEATRVYTEFDRARVELLKIMEAEAS